jgi:signal transduction histidine kinase
LTFSQLFLSHFVVAFLGVLVGSVFGFVGRDFSFNWFIGLVGLEFAFVLGLFGLFLAGNIWRGLRKLESVITQLAKGEVPAAPALRPRLHWPLSRLNPDLARIGERASQYSFRLDRVDQIRDQWLRQVGEAAAQAERNRLARDLHDSIKQQLFTISSTATSAQLRWDKDPQGAQADLAAVRRSVREAQTEMNVLLQQLRPAPLETVGLLEALKDQCQALEYRSGASVKFEAEELPPEERLPANAQETLFRIAQEALSNVARHARAETVTVSLRKRFHIGREWLLLEVEDDGQGFTVPKDFGLETAEGSIREGGMGLKNITERARDMDANINLKSKKGEGTTLQIWIPLLDPKPVETVSNPESLKKAALKLRANLILSGGITAALSLVGGGVFFGVTLASYQEMNEHPLTVIQNNILWLFPALIFLPINQLYVSRATRRLEAQQPGTLLEEIYWLALFREGAGLSLTMIGLFLVPLLPLIWLERPLSTNLQTLLAIILIAGALYFTWRLQKYTFAHLSQLSPAERSEKLEKMRKSIKWLPLLLITWGAQVYIQLGVFQPEIGEAAPIASWVHLIIVFLVLIGGFSFLLNYWFVFNKYKGRFSSLRLRSRVAIVAVPVIVSLAGLFLWILTGSKFEEIRSFQSAGERFYARQMVASPDGQSLVLLSTDGEGLLLDNQAKLKTRLPGLLKSESSQARIGWSKTTGQILFVEKTAVLKRWDVAGNPLPDLPLEGPTTLFSAAFTADGQRLIAGFGDLKQTGLWDTNSGRMLGKFPYSPGVLSPDGTKVAKSTGGGGISIVSLQTGKEIARSANGQFDQIDELAWSPDGQTIAAAYGYISSSEDEKPVRLWNIDGTLQATLTGHKRSINGLAWSPDGRYLLSAADDGLRLWNASGQEVSSFNKNFTNFGNPVWLDNGKSLATTNFTPLVSIWQINN